MSTQTTMVVRIDIHKYDEDAEDDSDYDIQDTKKYKLTEFTPDDKKIILDIVEKQMHDYIDFCREDDESEKKHQTKSKYFDYCNNSGYVRSRIKTTNVVRKGLKIYFDFKSCDSKKINKRMLVEVTDGFFSSPTDSVQLSNGEYVLVSQLDSCKGIPSEIFNENK